MDVAHTDTDTDKPHPRTSVVHGVTRRAMLRAPNDPLGSTPQQQRTCLVSLHETGTSIRQEFCASTRRSNVHLLQAWYFLQAQHLPLRPGQWLSLLHHARKNCQSACHLVCRRWNYTENTKATRTQSVTASVTTAHLAHLSENPPESSRSISV